MTPNTAHTFTSKAPRLQSNPPLCIHPTPPPLYQTGPVLVDIPKDVQQTLDMPDWGAPMSISAYMSRLPPPPQEAQLQQVRRGWRGVGVVECLVACGVSAGVEAAAEPRSKRVLGGVPGAGGGRAAATPPPAASTPSCLLTHSSAEISHPPPTTTLTPSGH